MKSESEEKEKHFIAMCSSQCAPLWIYSTSATVTPTLTSPLCIYITCSQKKHIHTITYKPCFMHATHLHPRRWHWQWEWQSLRQHPRPHRLHRMPERRPACYHSRHWWRREHMPCLKRKEKEKQNERMGGTKKEEQGDYKQGGCSYSVSVNMNICLSLLG